MVGAENILENFRLGKFVFERFGNEPIIDSPADVSFPRFHSITPPRILFFCARERRAKRVDKSGGERFRKRISLFDRIARISLVRFRIRQVDWLTRDVQISANCDRFFLRKLLQMRAKIAIPAKPIIEPREFILRVRNVCADEENFRKFERDDAAFLRMVVPEKICGKIQRLELRKNRRSRVAGLCRGMQKTPRERRFDRARERQTFGAFDFLEAQNVGRIFGDVAFKIFSKNSAKSVHIPGVQKNFFHLRN